ncbi:MAG: N-6 DNA methylase [Verrucomicrobiae bacterium]|nr:N-6 DNA methylase [Verrucomicrobiae bacterium]
MPRPRKEPGQTPPAKKTRTPKAPKAISGTRSLSAFVKSICDILRRSNCASALQYVPELTWILFLRILDEQERKEKAKAEAVGEPYRPALRSPYRWQDWAAPFARTDEALETHPRTDDGKPCGWKRQELIAAGGGRLFDFVNTELLPYLHSLDLLPETKLPNPDASPKQRVIGRIMTAVERVRVDNETNFQDVLDKVDEIHIDQIDDTHFFTLSQVYEDLLLKMGEKNSDGGQFFTPREVIRAMVHTAQPKLGMTVYDPCCGTGGFLAVAYEHIAREMGRSPASTDLDRLKHDTFFGREKDNIAFPIALANLVLHGIDQPNLWHGNTLTKQANYAALYATAPKTFDFILTNPPFGGKEGVLAQKNYAFQTGSTQVLFVQDILGELAEGGTCAIVLDDGFLFRKDEDAFVNTKRKMLDECDLWAVVSLPGGVFVGAGAAVKTNLLFFTKGRKTEKIWYYDLTHVKVGKKSPMTLAHFGFGRDGEVLEDGDLPAALTEAWKEDEDTAGDFPSYARLLPLRGTSEAESRYSWAVDFAARRRQARDDAQPHKDEANRLKGEVVSLKERLKALKSSDRKSDKIKELEERIVATDKAARESQSKADAIENAVYDLKAVNPNAVVKVDTRPPEEVIENIEAQGRLVAEALAALRGMLDKT